MRYLWTLERDGWEPRGDLDTVDALTKVLRTGELPGMMPPDWVVTTPQIDEDDDSVATNSSIRGWRLRVKRTA